MLSASASLTTNNLRGNDHNGLSVAMEAIPRKLDEKSWRSSEGLRPIELIVPLSVSPAGSASLRCDKNNEKVVVQDYFSVVF